MDKFAENDLKVALATPTTAQPAWLSKKYPEVLPVDKQGRKKNSRNESLFLRKQS